MKDARVMLENAIQENNANQKDLANFLGVSGPTISNYIHGTKELGFQRISKASGFLGDFQERILTQACTEFNGAANVKNALEYLATHGKVEELEHRIETAFFSKSSEWVEVYTLVLDFLRHQTDNETLLCDIRDVLKRVKTPELIALLYAIETNLYIRLDENKPVLRLATHNLAFIESLQESYIKQSLLVRVYEQLANTSLYAMNEPETARYYAERVIRSNIGAKFSADSFTLIGMSYWFEDLDAAVENLKTAAHLYAKIGRADVADAILRKNIEVIRAYWGVGLDEVAGLDAEEVAYKRLKGGVADDEETLALIAKESDEPFRLYYLGLATKDLTYYWQALGAFLARGDRFYAYLPYSELAKSKDKAAADAVY